MKKQTITVPANTKYLSMVWEEIKRQLPTGAFVLDKRACGCGATEAYLRDTSQKTILASPRKQLLYNKYIQHIGDCHLWHFENKEQYFSNSKDSEKKALMHINNLKDYVRGGGTKVLVTYDSLDKITDILVDSGEKLTNWVVVIDEMQAIFYDAYYKPTTELEFTIAVQRYAHVVYLSATPYLEEYLDALSAFKELPFVELDWSLNTIVKNKVEMVKYTSVQDECRKIINDYRSGNGRTTLVDGEVFTSKEVIIYVNSVNIICKVIEANKLTTAETDVICSTSQERNKKRLAELGFDISTIPAKDEPRKMFTFCTSTAYLGADMYSDDAYTFIFADPKINSMALDTSSELIQILGRQRNDTNPFKNTGTFFYTTAACNVTKEQMDANILKKNDTTHAKIENFNSATHKDMLMRDYANTVKVEQYRNDYCAIVKNEEGQCTIGINEIVVASEYRAWQIQHDIYNDEYAIYGTISANCDTKITSGSDNQEVQDFYTAWNADKNFTRRMKLFCDTATGIIEQSNFIPKKYFTYYEALGREGLEALSWREDYIKSALAPTPFDPKAKSEVAQRLIGAIQEGDVMGRKQIKSLLQDIYDNLGIKQKATAEDMKEYVTLQRVDKGFRVESLVRKNVSVFPNINDPEHGETWTVDKILQTIKTGKYFNLKHKVEEVRKQTTKEGRTSKKSFLRVVCWNGVFSYRNSNPDNLTCYSSYTALDFDHFENKQDMFEFIDKLKTYDWVYALFISPSGDGIKVIVLHDNLFPEYHADLYKKLMNELNIDEIDTHTKDLGRGNYMSYDPDLWFNPAPKAYHYEPDVNSLSQQTPPQTYTLMPDGNDIIMAEDDMDTAQRLYEFCTNIVSDESILRILKKRWETDDHDHDRNNKAFSYLGILCKAGITAEKAIPFVCSLFPDTWTDKEIEVTHASGWVYTHNKFGCERKKFNRLRR